MKNLHRLGILCLMVTTLFLSSSCEENCKETLFELDAVGIVPRTLDAAGNANTLWLNNAALSIDRLAVKVELEKPVQVYFTANPDCQVVYRNSNPIMGMQLVSSEDFNADLPAGSDLSEILTYTNLKSSLSKTEFIQEILNKTNLDTYYFLFDEKPVEGKLHSLQLLVQFKDGTDLESPPILVNLVP